MCFYRNLCRNTGRPHGPNQLQERGQLIGGEGRRCPATEVDALQGAAIQGPLPTMECRFTNEGGVKQRHPIVAGNFEIEGTKVAAAATEGDMDIEADVFRSAHRSNGNGRGFEKSLVNTISISS